MFAFDPHRLTAGREQIQCRNLAYQLFRDRGRPINKLFATIENDERWPFLQTVNQGRHDVICLYRYTESGRYGRRNERGVTESAQVYEVNLTVKDSAHFMGNGHRHCSLADAARPH